MLSAADIERVRAEHRLVDVLSRAGIATPAGGEARRYVMINCPMPGHDDSTPSMMVQPQLERYHCFGCGSHGDVLQLVMDLEDVRSLTLAAEILDSRRPIRSFPSTPSPARRRNSSRRHRTGVRDPGRTVAEPSATANSAAGPVLDATSQEEAVRDAVELPNLGRTEADRILELNDEAWRYLTAPRHAERAHAYLASRGMDLGLLESEAGRPLAGHTPSSPTGLSEHLVRRGFKLDELVDAGWLARWESGRVLDRFRRRLLIPARDRLDRVVGVYARDVTGRSSAKYLNTPETLVYRKREFLYRPTTHTLAAGGRVVVCEGTLDALAIAAVAASTETSDLFAPVAASGTALDTEQAGALLTISDRPPVLCADGDSAGRSAMAVWAATLTRLGRECVVMLLPDEKDPAEWLDRRGLAGLSAFVAGIALQPSEGAAAVQVPAGAFVAAAVNEQFLQLGCKDSLLHNLVTDRLASLASFLDDHGDRRRFAESAAGALSRRGLASAETLERRILSSAARADKTRSAGGAPPGQLGTSTSLAHDRGHEVSV